MSLLNCGIIELPKILDVRGNLTFIEGQNHVPFEVKRTYWIYDVPGGEVRGGHAYKENEELIIALSGSFEVVLNDGLKEVRYSLNRSYEGVYICPGIWRQLENFSTNSLALILASTEFNEDDYLRNMDEYNEYKKHRNSQHQSF